jgi:hypothetical protein
MTDRCIIPADTEIGRALRDAARERRLIAIAGLPGCGKSLLVQQLIVLARQAGRNVTILQWDAARRGFETPDWLARYPEHNDLTHPGIRKAVGLWSRDAVAHWRDTHSDASDLLIAELPVVGGRFAELLQPAEDAAEPFLAGAETVFFTPVPTVEMRRVIVGARAETFANPRNEQETKDAPIYIVENDWRDTRRLHNRWTGAQDDPETDAVYDPQVYAQVFERLGRFRPLRILSIDRPYAVVGSVYDGRKEVIELKPGAEAVRAAFAEVERRYPGKAAGKATDDWAEF